MNKMTFMQPRTCLSQIHSSLRFCVRLASGHTKIQRDGEDSVPRIVFPHKIVLHLEKSKSKQKEKKRRANFRKSKPLGSLLISCKRKGYNFHKNEKFDESGFSKLVSQGWKNSKRVGDYFTLLPQSSDDTLTFEDVGLCKELSSALLQLGFEHPTNIQKYAIPSLLRGDNVICAAETGSGKTFAYLLPVIERLIQQKQILASRFNESHDQGPNFPFNSPHAIVITPSRELTEQVMNVAETLSSYVGFQPHCSIGASRKSEMAKYRKISSDILISTAGALNNMLVTGQVGRANLQSIIIDESDTLLDDSFVTDIQRIFHRLRVTPVESPTEDTPFLFGQQIVLVSATMPKNLESALGNTISIDSMKKITTSDLHHLMPHVRQTFVRVKPSAKPEKLVQILKRNAEKNETSLVFTNNNRTCYYVSKLLESSNLSCQWIHGDMATKERIGVFSNFKEGHSNILVATDVVSRGLDTTNVHHVINYDFPTFMSDYVHRVGRVGRVGTEHAGDAISFVTTKWDVELLWKIEIAARKQKKLDNVDANIKKILDSRKAKHDKFTLDIV